ncbi:hypothetical protein D3C75_848510 [compost metagenome]
MRHEVNSFGGATRPDNIFSTWRVKQTSHAIASGFISFCKALGFGKLTAMNIPGAQAIKLSGGFNHRERFKCGCCAVEIDTGISQSRKLAAKFGWIK